MTWPQAFAFVGGIIAVFAGIALCIWVAEK